MAVNYGTLELELTNKINAYLVTKGVRDLFNAVPIPDNETELEESRDRQKGTVYIKYHTSKYGPTDNIDQIVQPETITIRCIFNNPSLRNEKGFYNLIKLVKSALLGYIPQSCSTRLVICHFDLLEFLDQGWKWILDFDTTTTNCQEDDPEILIGGNFTGLDFSKPPQFEL